MAILEIQKCNPQFSFVYLYLVNCSEKTLYIKHRSQWEQAKWYRSREHTEIMEENLQRRLQMKDTQSNLTMRKDILSRVLPPECMVSYIAATSNGQLWRNRQIADYWNSSPQIKALFPTFVRETRCWFRKTRKTPRNNHTISVTATIQAECLHTCSPWPNKVLQSRVSAWPYHVLTNYKYTGIHS
jgi:hypothetical protein